MVLIQVTVSLFMVLLFIIYGVTVNISIGTRTFNASAVYYPDIHETRRLFLIGYAIMSLLSLLTYNHLQQLVKTEEWLSAYLGI